MTEKISILVPCENCGLSENKCHFQSASIVQLLFKCHIDESLVNHFKLMDFNEITFIEIELPKWNMKSLTNGINNYIRIHSTTSFVTRKNCSNPNNDCSKHVEKVDHFRDEIKFEKKKSGNKICFFVAISVWISTANRKYLWRYRHTIYVHIWQINYIYKVLKCIYSQVY